MSLCKTHGNLALPKHVYTDIKYVAAGLCILQLSPWGTGNKSREQHSCAYCVDSFASKAQLRFPGPKMFSFLAPTSRYI